MFINLVLMMFMLFNYSEIRFWGSNGISVGFFCWIYGYTTLMDRKSMLLLLELIRGGRNIVDAYLGLVWAKTRTLPLGPCMGRSLLPNYHSWWSILYLFEREERELKVVSKNLKQRSWSEYTLLLCSFENKIYYDTFLISEPFELLCPLNSI